MDIWGQGSLGWRESDSCTCSQRGSLIERMCSTVQAMCRQVELVSSSHGLASYMPADVFNRAAPGRSSCWGQIEQQSLATLAPFAIYLIKH